MGTSMESQLKNLNGVFFSFHNMKYEIDSMKDAIRDQKKVSGGMYDEMYAEIASLKNRVSRLEEQQNQQKKDSSCEVRINTLDGFSRRNNLIFHGIPGPVEETNGDCEGTLRQTLTQHFDPDINVSEIQFDRVHRLRTNKTHNQPIIARFTFAKDRERILKARTKLKGTKIFINEDFTFQTREKRKILIQFMKQLRLKDNPPRVNLVFDHLYINGERYNLDHTQKSIKNQRNDTINLDDISPQT